MDGEPTSPAGSRRARVALLVAAVAVLLAATAGLAWRWRVRGEHRAGGPAGVPERPAPPDDKPTRPPTSFLPGLANGHPSSLFEPAIVSDPTDGQIAHLHGLNLYRAYAHQQLTRTLPDADPRGPVLRDAARRHAEASLSAVCGGDYMVEHCVAC
jgi:Protein of unknown function (DUF2891)